ncbi:unnamed protein product, partial [Meganyctiphanes norvegica]
GESTTIAATTIAATTATPIKTLACSKKTKTKKLKSGESVMITSPKFPEDYPNKKTQCSWKIKTAKKKDSLKISCDTFKLNGKDFLKIGKKKYKGKKAPTKLAGKNVSIDFKTEKNSSGEGFSCVVKAK